MIDIAILRAMVAAGAPVEAILAAVEADQAAERVRVQARRDADAERQRRRRVTPCHADTAGQTVTPRDTADGSLTSSLLSSQVSENKQEKGRKKERAARVGKSLLPDDWAPTAAHYTKGDRGFVERKADDMRNWAKSKAIMRADWDATFHGFLRNDTNGKGHVNGARNPTMEAFDDLIDRAGGQAVGDDPPMVDVTPRRA